MADCLFISSDPLNRMKGESGIIDRVTLYLQRWRCYALWRTAPGFSTHPVSRET